MDKNTGNEKITFLFIDVNTDDKKITEHKIIWDTEIQ